MNGPMVGERHEGVQGPTVQVSIQQVQGKNQPLDSKTGRKNKPPGLAAEQPQQFSQVGGAPRVFDGEDDLARRAPNLYDKYEDLMADDDDE